MLQKTTHDRTNDAIKPIYENTNDTQLKSGSHFDTTLHRPHTTCITSQKNKQGQIAKLCSLQSNERNSFSLYYQIYDI